MRLTGWRCARHGGDFSCHTLMPAFRLVGRDLALNILPRVHIEKRPRHVLKRNMGRSAKYLKRGRERSSISWQPDIVFMPFDQTAAYIAAISVICPGRSSRPTLKFG